MTESEEKKDATEEKEEKSEERRIKVSALSPHQQRRDIIGTIQKSRIADLQESGVDIKDEGDELLPDEERARLEAGGLIEEIEQEPEPPPEEEETEEKPPTEKEEEKEEEKTPPSDEEMVTIKVRGEEQEVPKSKVMEAGIRHLQKESDLDKRYNEVATMQKELDRKLKDLESGKPLPKEEDETSEEEEETDEEQELKELAYNLQYGSEEEAVEALKLLKASPAKTKEHTGLTREDLDEILDQRDRVREIRTKFSAPVEDGGFADIMAHEEIYNSILLPKINRMLTPEEEGGMGLPNVWKTYEKAGLEVREAYGAILGSKKKEDEKKPKVSVGEDKKARKEERDSPTGASIKSESETEETKPAPSEDPNPKKTIDEMRKARGQYV